MKDSEVLKLRRPPPFYPRLASRSLLSVALLGCLPSLDAAVCVMRLHGLFFGTEQLDISGSIVLADKAYGSWENREYIANHGADFCIPPKSDSVDPWYTDFYHYKERHLVECFFMKIKEHRRIATRFEKLACRFLAFIHLAAALLCFGFHNFACW